MEYQNWKNNGRIQLIDFEGLQRMMRRWQIFLNEMGRREFCGDKTLCGMGCYEFIPD